LLKSIYLGAFGLFERVGIHVSPVHHTQPFPDTRRLGPQIWQRPSALVGIDMRESEQLELLESFAARFKGEYDALPRQPAAGGPVRFYTGNPFFGPIDAEILYCMIRRLRPRRVVEIGSGFSTLLAKQALSRNDADGYAGRLDTYDPKPAAMLATIADASTSVNVARAEDLPLETFASLGAGDILFIDSTHVVRIGGDVCYELLEVVPRLAPGVNVHFHDIFLPDQYPRKLVMGERIFWTEQYLLQAFLAFNGSFEVVWGSAFMQRKHLSELASAFASFDPQADHTGGSFWIRRTS
jgi:predicted O-methyltransferase YrrM